MAMKKILSVLAVFVCAVSFGQNINPTVEVTNIYQGNPSEVHKPQLGMAIPDSLMRFDMDFGYEVFEKPYQGAYNFKPYQLAMRPDKDAYRGRKLYLKAGAGYSLRPQLDFVFSPEQSGPFQMSVYANHRSYFGKYNIITPVPYQDFNGMDKVPGKSYNGHDAVTKVGLDGRYNWEEAVLSFDIGYYGLLTKDTLLNRSYNAFDYNVRFTSNKDDDKYIFYDVALGGRFGSDMLKYTNNYVLPGINGEKNLNENLVLFTANAGPVLSRTQRVLVGLEAETASYRRDLFRGNAGRIALIPRYQFNYGPWNLSVGLKVETLLTSKDSLSFQSMFSKRGSLVYPDVHARYTVNDNLLAYANLTGGARMNTYSSLIAANHHFNPGYYAWTDRLIPLLDNSIDKIDFNVGVKGNLLSMLQYEVRGGVKKVENGYLDAPVFSYSIPKPGGVYSDYSLIYADLLLGLHYGDFDIDGGIHLRKTTFDEEKAPGLILPPFYCDLKAVYNFSPRLYAGMTVQASSARKGYSNELFVDIDPVDPDNVSYRNLSHYPFRVPGYLDLGLLAGYKLNRKLGVWLESGNLLCETIQRNPFYSEKDLWVTAGITLNL